MAVLLPLEMTTFSTGLGWMALVASPRAVNEIVYGYPSAAAAVAALDPELVDAASDCRKWRWLVDRLTDFARGRVVDFRGVPIDVDYLTPFSRRVVKLCRAIPYGQTRSYGELAALAGSPRAARAVGNTMADCRFAVVVPCHRVINADGSPGHYGAPGGSRFKQQVLELERRTLAKRAGVRRLRRTKTRA